MATFSFRNQQPDAAELVIEPWALVEQVDPDGEVEFEVNDAPPAEVEFSVTPNGEPFIYVMSERVIIRVDGVPKHEFETEIRPPSSVFRALNYFRPG